MSSEDFKALAGLEDFSEPFDPMALRIFDNKNGTKAWFFSEKSTNGLYAFLPEETKNRMVNLMTSNPECTIVDIAVEDNSHEQNKGNELVILVLSDCGRTDSQAEKLDKVIKVDFDKETRGVSWTDLKSLPLGVEGRSIEFIYDNNDGALTRKYYVGVHPLENKAQKPHIYEYSTVDLRYEQPVLLLSHLDNTRAGIDIGMIRRNRNGLIYASEQSFGLPLVLNSSLPGPIKVIGQTGKKHGDLADSYAIAFNPNTFGLNSRIEHSIPMEVKAGTQYKLFVDLKNSMGEPVLVETFLEGSISGIEGTTGSQVQKSISRDDFVQWSTTIKANMYNCTIKLKTASSSLMRAEDMWEMKFKVAGLGMSLGTPINFWVTPGPTFASQSKLLKTYDMALSGETVTIIIETYDEFGNRRNFNSSSSVEEDNADVSMFKVMEREKTEATNSLHRYSGDGSQPTSYTVSGNSVAISLALFSNSDISSAARKNCPWKI